MPKHIQYTHIHYLFHGQFFPVSLLILLSFLDYLWLLTGMCLYGPGEVWCSPDTPSVASHPNQGPLCNIFVIPNTNRNNLFYRHVSRQNFGTSTFFFFCFLVMSSHFSLNRQLYHCCVEQATILCKRTGTSPYPSSGIFHLCFCTNLSITAQRNYTLMCKCRSVSRFRQHLGFFRKEL